MKKQIKSKRITANERAAFRSGLTQLERVLENAEYLGNIGMRLDRFERRYERALLADVKMEVEVLLDLRDDIRNFGERVIEVLRKHNHLTEANAALVARELAHFVQVEVLWQVPIPPRIG